MSLAFVFPGQGSQAVGMLAGLAREYPLVTDTFQQASDVLGYDLWALVQDNPDDKLNQTEFTQPALLTAGYAAWLVYQAQASAKQPAYLAGHSLGEYTAWVCAGSIAFTDAVKLVAERGRAMQAAVGVGEGAMAAIIGLEDADVTAVCEEAAEGDVVSTANFNTVGQVVIAGHSAAVDRALPIAKAKGAKIAKRIPVSVPSHCQLMAGAAEHMTSLLKAIEINAPTIPVVNNVDVDTPKTADAIRDGLVRQLTQSVRWVETVRYLMEQGVTTCVECGPGKVLTGLNKRISRDLTLTAFADPATLGEVLTSI